MTQIAWPISDDSNVGWSPSPVYSQINEIVPLDDKWVTSGAPAQFTVKLRPLQPPGPGPQQVLLHMKQLGTGVTATVALLQGLTTQVALRQFIPSGVFQLYSFSLTSSEIALITNYTDLHLRVSLPPNCQSTPVPTTLYATLSSAFHCGCASNGPTIVMNWNGIAWVGSGPFGNCGHTIMLKLTGPQAFFGICSDYSLTVSWTDNCDNGLAAVSAAGCNCSPMFFQFGVDMANPGDCNCPGTIFTPGTFLVHITP
jgi:hypothetical protein